MADWYWYNDNVLAVGDNKFQSNNWAPNADGSGVYGAPGAGDLAHMGDDYGGGSGNSDNCNVDAAGADVTMAILSLAEPTGYSGTLTIEVGRKITVTGNVEFMGAIVHTGALDVVDIQSFATHTGNGAVNVSGEVRASPGMDWSGYGGAFTWDGAGAVAIYGTADSWPAFILNGAGSLTADDDDITFAGLTLTAGTFNTAGFNINTGTGITQGGGTYNAGATLTMPAITGTGGTFNMLGAYIKGTGALNFANITVTNASGGKIVGGTVSNLGGAAAVPCFGCTDGGGNGANVTFDEHAWPGSFMVLGLGTA